MSLDPHRRRRPLATRTCARSLTAQPGLVPVARATATASASGRLARKAAWLGCDTLAVGTYSELPEVAEPLPR